MEIQTDKQHSVHPAPAQASPATPAMDTASDIDALASAMAEQGVFGKLKMGAALLLFGEVTLPDTPPHDA